MSLFRTTSDAYFSQPDPLSPTDGAAGAKPDDSSLPGDFGDPERQAYIDRIEAAARAANPPD